MLKSHRYSSMSTCWHNITVETLQKAFKNQAGCRVKWSWSKCWFFTPHVYISTICPIEMGFWLVGRGALAFGARVKQLSTLLGPRFGEIQTFSSPDSLQLHQVGWDHRWTDAFRFLQRSLCSCRASGWSSPDTVFTVRHSCVVLAGVSLKGDTWDQSKFRHALNQVFIKSFPVLCLNLMVFPLILSAEGPSAVCLPKSCPVHQCGVYQRIEAVETSWRETELKFKGHSEFWILNYTLLY